MTLVDASIWIDHLRVPDPMLATLLAANEVLMHPVVVGEISLGSMKNRAAVLRTLDSLPVAHSLLHEEVRGLIERHLLWGSGIGFSDAHLLGATLLTSGALLWTRDRRLQAAAAKLGVAAVAIH